jgi:molybdopterin-guanine dinucleotide biosynthesis protein A
MHEHSQPEGLSAVVLAGGQSRRMGGKDKGLIELAGKPMIAHVLKRLDNHISDIMISTNSSNTAYQQMPYRLTEDILKENLGPLAGIHSALINANNPRVLITACDSPFLETQLCSRLVSAMDKHKAMLAVAYDGEHVQNTFSVIDVRLKNNLEQYLQRGGRRLMTWFKEQDAIEVDFSDVKDSFFNINSSHDLTLAEHKLINT